MSTSNFLITNIAQDVNHEETLKPYLKSAKRIRIVSPYVTLDGVNFLLSNTMKDVQLDLVTELSVAGIMHGSQSPSSLGKLREKCPCNIYYFTNNLHSKLFIIDDNILVTSANLTRGGLKDNFETGIFLSDLVKDSLSKKLKDLTIAEVNAYWDNLTKKASDLDDEDLKTWLDKEIVLKAKKVEFDEAIKEIINQLPKNDYSGFKRELAGRNVITELSASNKLVKLDKSMWDVFRTDHGVLNDANRNKFRKELDEAINPILDSLFSAIRMNKLLEVNISNLTYSFSQNLMVRNYFPNNRYLYMTTTGIGGDYRKRHIEYPTFILSMGIDGDRSWIELRSGVEEDVNTTLCKHAKRLLEQISENWEECYSRMQQMGEGWVITHGQQRKNEREIVIIKEMSIADLKRIVEKYLRSGKPADFHISHVYYWGENEVLEQSQKFVDSLAKDLNHLNYFFMLAHFS